MTANEKENAFSSSAKAQQYPDGLSSATEEFVPRPKRPEPVLFRVGAFFILCDGYDTEDESQTPVASTAAKAPTVQVSSDVASQANGVHRPSSLAVYDDASDAKSDAPNCEADTSLTTEMSVTEIMRELELLGEENKTTTGGSDVSTSEASEVDATKLSFSPVEDQVSSSSEEQSV
ncbi:uncharacterized protein SCHCODRAFT_02583133 [Schizophyllum commune H4-8]|nr:uncharacterized protein SCHCODRAFT_02583133 [Schizophyllum commune H4-8]KAI5890304.1 hypothetical protein SCHCODRAFT_02583133 [Schizophyllum commune H4-8]